MFIGGNTVDKETVLQIVTAQAQGISNESLYQSEDSPEWAYTLMQGGAWALAVLYAEFKEEGIDPMDVVDILKLQTSMTYGERRALVEELFNE